MLNSPKLNTLLVIIFLSNLAIAQHYDIGYNTDYQNIQESPLDTTKFKEIIYTLSSNKKLKKIFNKEGHLVEELVFINGKLSVGIEYYIHTKYPFLDVPRSFKIENIERIISNYENIKLTSSLIKYMPKLKKAIFQVRVYQHKDSEFYILKSNKGEELYFK